MAIADTGFLSSFSKIGRLKLILKALKLKSIVVPSTVYEELKNSGFFEDISRLFAFKELDLTEQSFILVRHVDLSSLSSHFSREELNFLGRGELGCFMLARKTGDIVLIDDRVAGDFAKKSNIKAASIPSFLLYCKNHGILSSGEIRQVMEDLRKKDYYQFSREIRDMLLK